MIDVDLSPSLANQLVSIDLDGRYFEVRVKCLGTTMVADISRDGVLLVEGVRAVASVPLIPPYLEQGGGNFAFVCNTDDLPFYTSFGSSQFLVYLTADELAALRA